MALHEDDLLFVSGPVGANNDQFLLRVGITPKTADKITL